MEQLSITLLNVGFGDSIFIEYEQGSNYFYGLIDSNDTTKIKNTHCYLNRYFKQISIERKYDFKNPYFDFVMVSHDHSDHAKGIKDIIVEYGTNNFYYSISETNTVLPVILKYVNRKKINNKAIKMGDVIDFGGIKIRVLWPGTTKDSNENNNSIVLLIECFNKKILLTGDAESSVWTELSKSGKIPSDINLIKLPHHGSTTSFFNGSATPVPIWDSFLAIGNNKIGISTNLSPKNYHLPSDDVIKNLNSNSYEYYRTDQHENITFIITDSGIRCKYSHE